MKSQFLSAVLIGGLMLGWSQPAHPLKKVPNNRGSQNKTDSAYNAQQNVRISFDTSFFVNQLESLRTEIKRSQSRSENKNQKAYWKPSWILKIESLGITDWTITVLTIILIVAVWRQLVWMKRTVTQMVADGASREEAEKIKLRARVNIRISPEEATIVKNGNGNIEIQIIPRITNHGETVAEYMVFRGEFIIQALKDSLPTPDDVIKFFKENPPHISTIFGIIHDTPNSFGKGIEHPVKNQKFSTPETDWPFVVHNESKSRIIYFGFIKYQDVFRDVWVRKFMWIIIDAYKSTAISINCLENEEYKDDKWPKNQ